MSDLPPPIPLELLAPAGTADIGIAAVDHGADAVYIGAPRFSARANAGVDTAEIARLIRHAHLYYARVYVALNTILTDEELPQAVEVIHQVHELGADGLIIQDPGLLETDLPAIPLIASTQMHNDRPEKIRFLEDVGFRRAILARELSVEEITAIRRETKIELEFFVHGALCVSYSGQCYMSHALTGRSGNRGVCAQPCRSRYTLIDGDGKEIVSDRFLLSLRDLNLAQDIPSLAAAGITSFKIEGRYKEIDYVKNVTAAYSRVLDDFISCHPEYHRCSSGRCQPAFSPNLLKTFNRGFTRYFLSGRNERIASFSTQKSIGEPVGRITAVGKNFFYTDCADLQNGDGLCFFSGAGSLEGFRVDRIEHAKVFPNSMNGVEQGVRLYRNMDTAFSRLLHKPSSRRQIGLEMSFRHKGGQVSLAAADEDGNSVEVTEAFPFEEPRDLSAAKAQIAKHLSSTGNTPFAVTKLDFGRIGFYPVRFLNAIRRQALEELVERRLRNFPRISSAFHPNDIPYPQTRLDFRANVLNQHARRFYKRHGAEVLEPAFEALAEHEGREVMHTRYCIRHELDACHKFNKSARHLKEPLRLRDNRNEYLLKFDCKACRMSVIFLGRK